jgi:EAL domain-containing protein (putative c-di-GMP-specific phosphodiesterase class I)
MGGDEFVIILENLSRELPEAVTQTALVIEKIWKALEDPFIINEKRLSCTSSAGISLFYNHDEPSESVLKQADLALYKAKNAGRNCQRFYDPAMQIAMDERSALESDLRLALSHKEFYLYFQPQVDSSHRLLGAEALLRWQHPHRGLVLPEQFISLAEEVGLILSIGEWVLKTACAQIKKWSTGTKTRKLKIAVNVSARQLHQSGFVAQVEQILTETGIDPTRLKIELTESMVLQDIEETIKTMNALKRIGIGFSMDDFGTGYSSLSYLTRLPLEQLKIDQSFVFNLPDNVNDGIIAQTIITMGRSLGLEVIAEGVESEAQHAFLSKIGCYAYQGYLFSKPLPMRSFEAFMRRKKIKSTTLDAAR